MAVESGPPPVDAPNFGRVFATIVYASETRTMLVTAVVLVDAADQTCRITGVAIPTS